jgi:hypothetical protein
MTIATVTNFKINFPGQNNNVVPRFGHLHAPNNTLSQISAAGFLDGYIQSQNISILATDLIAAVGSDGTQWYKPVFTGTSCQLTVLP